MNNKYFASILLDWYWLHKRDLPWRNTKDPYIIWLSEIILQQTRVAQGLPYFEKFINKYPKVENLAEAPADEVMRLWQGLGYYSRARNLHQCAKEVVSVHGGQFPNSYQELLRLKGVGSYTAAAIASFAFDQSVAVVDGNVFRVLARYFGVSTDIASHAGKKEFEAMANRFISKEQPGQYNQAIMEFGSLQCTPKNPDCLHCPLQQGCSAFKDGLVEQLPVKINRIKVKTRYFNYLYIRCGTEVIVKQRGAGDIWQGLYDFPLEETANSLITDVDGLGLLSGIETITDKIRFYPESTFKHILTHQRIFANFVEFVINEKHNKVLRDWVIQRGFEIVDMETLENLPKPRLILRFLNGEK
ncbi:A/G-specific DNA-adenine glycosylase [Belliella buryatensis]|uniref:Adenine DNA glycosylase n=1 Tax=Belliella buryatensis TaxID=1500549 RepID=A0A239BS95_9BACT|nr:A/G-specific adenine glycosylase [Belliella buryatensis]SNS10925.1 A/G-specific DNA-adenine glycosylase [Belliella buryatensis]